MNNGLSNIKRFYVVFTVTSFVGSTVSFLGVKRQQFLPSRSCSHIFQITTMYSNYFTCNYVFQLAPKYVIHGVQPYIPAFSNIFKLTTTFISLQSCFSIATMFSILQTFFPAFNHAFHLALPFFLACNHVSQPSVSASQFQPSFSH